MPEQVQCPNCKQKLRVPDNLLGKKVKCPKCATVFEAKVKPAAAPAAPPAEEDEGGSYLFEPAPPPEPKKKAIRYSDDYGGDDEEEEDDEAEEDERPKKKKKKRKHNAEALKKIAGPATLLQISAVLGLILNILAAGVNFVPAVRERIPRPQGQQVQMEATTAEKVGGVIGSLVGILIQVIILLIANRMKRLESYREALIISIIALIPCCTCCITGIPFGIWSLVVIHSPEVRPLFKT